VKAPGLHQRAAVRVLTFNWHESYLHMLASIGFDWDAVRCEKGGRQDWWAESRPQPSNLRLVDIDDATRGLKTGRYHAVVCHSVADLCRLPATRVPRIAVFHVCRDRELAHGQDAARFDEVATPLLADALSIFISETKRRSWARDGLVIPPGIDPRDYGGYRGDVMAGLVVGNLLCELAATNALSTIDAIMRGFPMTIAGLNPSIPGSHPCGSWDELREHFRSHRLFLNHTRAPFEDGYNLAMLEAMATGMPIVTLPNPTSPIENEVNGFVSDDPAQLREGVMELFEDADKAARLGAAARRTALEQFPIERFRDRWRQVLLSARAGASPSEVRDAIAS